MADHQDDALLGRLALHFKLITQEQLVEATVVQEREGGTTQFGEILVKLGYITAPRLQQLLATQREYLAKRKAEAAAKLPPPSPAAVADSQRVIEPAQHLEHVVPMRLGKRQGAVVAAGARKRRRPFAGRQRGVVLGGGVQ